MTTTPQKTLEQRKLELDAITPAQWELFGRRVFECIDGWEWDADRFELIAESAACACLPRFLEPDELEDDDR